MDFDNPHRLKMAESRIKDWLYFEKSNTIRNLNSGIFMLDLSELGLYDCDEITIPDAVKKISLSRNHFDTLPVLNETIEELTYNECFIKEIT